MKLSTWYRRYRIMPDNHLGYEARIWTIWFPFWRQIGFCNTHSSYIKAYKFAKDHKEGLKNV